MQIGLIRVVCDLIENIERVFNWILQLDFTGVNLIKVWASKEGRKCLADKDKRKYRFTLRTI